MLMGTSELYSTNLFVYNLFVCNFVLKSNIMKEKETSPSMYMLPFYLQVAAGLARARNAAFPLLSHLSLR